VLHISAHGVFDQLHADGSRRSGVVLSDGLLITAAEIKAMEVVPELVFLNCCHLGQIDVTVRDGNKLAASVARELIEIGVRCVIVAGWAVNDEQARLFGETFYRSLLLQRLPFGDAVFEARRKVWDNRADDITWGAFQAYGDPLWLAERRGEGSVVAPGKWLYASPEEALDALASLCSAVARRSSRQNERESRADAEAVKRLIDDHCPPEWLNLPALQSALGATWRDLGEYEQARTAFLRAVQAEDRLGRVPITDIQQLANIESLLGERQRDVGLIHLGLQRLRQLDSLVIGADGAEPLVPDRCALQGEAQKRLAFLHAQRLLDSTDREDGGVIVSGGAMMEALVAAVAAYKRAEGVAGQPGFRPSLALSRLALDALTPWPSDGERDAALAIGQQCFNQAGVAFQQDSAFLNAVLRPEAQFVQGLLNRSIGAAGEAGEAAWQGVIHAYTQALSNITVKPKDMDLIQSQMVRLATLLDAVAVFSEDDDPVDTAAMRRIADRLIELADSLQPGVARQRAARAKLPASPAGAEAAARQRKDRDAARAEAAAIAALAIDVPPARKGSGARRKRAPK
jgi:hypothetical protein